MLRPKGVMGYNLKRYTPFLTGCEIMRISDFEDKDKKKRTISVTDDSARRNPIAVAAQRRYSGTGAAGYHTTSKYTRKSKHNDIHE